ncbi:hypothetical protein HanPSC8_Chr12g0534341 [Helianthus annuus]|nr:hypothetical protein HanPSC8_Chr12g0534341 [Helianthus annuus]
MAINNAKVLHDQERHHRDYQSGLPYAEHSGWTNYPDLPYPQGPSDPTPHRPEAVGSSFVPIPYQPPPQGEQSPSITIGRCSRPSMVILTNPTRQWIQTSDISGRGTTCCGTTIFMKRRRI